MKHYCFQVPVFLEGIYEKPVERMINQTENEFHPETILHCKSVAHLPSINWNSQTAAAKTGPDQLSHCKGHWVLTANISESGPMKIPLKFLDSSSVISSC